MLNLFYSVHLTPSVLLTLPTLPVLISLLYTLLNTILPTPSILGTGWMESIMERLETGEADMREIPMLDEISRSIEGHTICALGDAAAWPVQVE